MPYATDRGGSRLQAAQRMGARRAQRGVAVLMALAIVSIATIVVSGLFWRQQVTLRSVENQMALAQARWIEHAAMEQVRWVLVMDARADARAGAVDHLKEMWALPLPETKLDANVAGGEQIADDQSRTATLAGGVLDEQARFNLTNLVVSQKPNEAAVNAFKRLLQNLGLRQEIAESVVAYQMASTVGQAPEGVAGGQPTAGDTNAPPRMLRPQDLLRIPGIDEETLKKLIPFVTLLPQPTKVNINTASPAVLAAVIPKLSLADAQRIVGQRELAWFRSPTDLQKLVTDLDATQLADVSVNSNWFTGTGIIRYERVETVVDTLMQRNGAQVQIIERRIR